MKIQQRENTRLRKRARSVGKAAVLQIRGRKIRKKTGAGALPQLSDSRAASIWKAPEPGQVWGSPFKEGCREAAGKGHPAGCRDAGCDAEGGSGTI